MSSARSGVSLGYWQDRDPLEAIETASLADALGFHELWLGEMATFDAFALAVEVARRTTRIPLTIGPLAVAVRDPVMIAMGVASVHALTGRQVDVAIGSSSPVVVSMWHGREFDRLPARLRDAACALRTLLAGERESGYRLRLPAADAALTIAAFGSSAVGVAAAHADRMVLNLVTPATVARLVTDLRIAAQRCDRAAPRVAVWVAAAVDPTTDGIDQLRRGLVPYLAAPGYGEMFVEAGFAPVVALARSGARPADVFDAVPRELVDAVAAVGDSAACRARIEDYRSAGAHDIAIVPVTAGDPGGRRTLSALAP